MGLQHKTVGTALTQAEWELGASHEMTGGVKGDMIYADSGLELIRLPIGNTNTVLQAVSGVPVWGANLKLADGSNIGIASDTDLLTLASALLTVNGAVTLSTGALTLSSGDITSSGTQHASGNSAFGFVGHKSTNAETGQVWDWQNYGSNGATGTFPAGRLVCRDVTNDKIVWIAKPHATAPSMHVENDLQVRLGDLTVTNGDLVVSAGDLGIGAAPSLGGLLEILDANDGGTSTIYFRNTGTTAGTAEEIFLGSSSNRGTAIRSISEGSGGGNIHNMAFAASAAGATPTNKVFIEGDTGRVSVLLGDLTVTVGFIGVGEASPETMFHGYDTINSTAGMVLENDSGGTAASTSMQLRNAAGTVLDAMSMYCMGSAWVTAGGYVQDAGVIVADTNLVGGMSLICKNTAVTADMRFYTGGSASGNLRATLDSTGLFGLGTDPAVLFHVFAGDSLVAPNVDSNIFTEDSGNNYVEIASGDSSLCGILLTSDAGNNAGIISDQGSNTLDLFINDNKSYLLLNANNDTVTLGDTATTATTVTGSLTVVGDLLFSTSGGGLQCGGISAENNAVETTINIQNDWEQVLVFDTNNASNGTTPDHTNDHITILKTGIYMAQFSASVISAGSNKVYEFEVRSNNGTVTHNNVHCDRKISTAGDVGSLGGSGLISFTATDTVELWVRNKTDITNLTFEDLTLTIFQVAG